MSATLATFPPRLQEPVTEGILSPLSAWQIEWELWQTSKPWDESVLNLHRRVVLYHWETQDEPVQ